MRPSQLRDYIGHQHLQLRILFVEIREALDGKGDPRPLVRKLVREVWDHLAVEDRLLLPTLRAIDAWGPLRAEQVAVEHARQRRQLKALRKLAGAEAARSALTLIGELMTDMDAEERDLLGPDLLRDDVVAIAQSGG